MLHAGEANHAVAPGSANLRDLEVLVVDCQASGATPEHGDLLELAWGFVGPSGLRGVEAHWIRPKTGRPISVPVRRLLGWSEECLRTAIEAEVAWARLLAQTTAGMPTVIHWARFERTFLKALYGSEPPLDIRCLHAMAVRLFYGLPKKNLRALAGHLGHSASLLRQARGHVEATAHVWRAIMPRLEREGVARWGDLDAFLARPIARSTKPIFPYPAEKRRLLPDCPGVYRFLRSNGDALYVGKAASLRKRVTSHFASRNKKSDALEMLSQAADVAFTATETPLEAALLEVEEIHRLDPPYNAQLRVGERRAWFASRDFDDVRDAPDPGHRIGPLPSSGAVAGLSAMTKLLAGIEPSVALRAAAVRVPEGFAPDRVLFGEVWTTFAPQMPLLLAGRALHPLREEEASHEGADIWTHERVRRHLARTLAGESLLVRRARLLSLLADAHVSFCENGRERHLGEERGKPRSRLERELGFDAKTYDRIRVLATELRRIHLEGGYIQIRIGRHSLPIESLFSAL
jgi:DNA polymerase III epsilon subunit-like protein